MSNTENIINTDDIKQEYEQFVDTLNDTEANEKIKAVRSKKAAGPKKAKPKPNTDEQQPSENLIGSSVPSPKSKKVSALGSVDNNNLLGSRSADRRDKVSEKPEKPKVEKVAIFSTKNVTWGSVGKVYRGYNIVSKDEAEHWLTRSHIRLATPEEVAKEFGN
jgi:hypothetical protein